MKKQKLIGIVFFAAFQFLFFEGYSQKLVEIYKNGETRRAYAKRTFIGTDAG